MAKQKNLNKQKPRSYRRVKILSKVIGIDFVETVETEDGDIMRNNYSSECQHAAHEDFSSSVDGLIPHLLRICEILPDGVDDIKDIDPSMTDKIRMTGFTISGYHENEGVILTGMRKIKSGLFYNIVTPLMRFDNEDQYNQMGELKIAIQKVQEEANSYLNGKFGEGSQFELSFENKMQEQEAA